MSLGEKFPGKKVTLYSTKRKLYQKLYMFKTLGNLVIYYYHIDEENRGKTLLTISSNDFIASIFRKGKNMVFRLEEVFRDDANELQKSSIFEYAIPIELLNNSRQEDPVLGADGYQRGFPVVREKNGGKINFREINLIN